jgi:predicted nucleic acid-binding protein
MSKEPRETFVLDSFAMLAYLDGESGMAHVQDILQLAQRGRAQASMSMINLGEVLYITERERGLPQAQQVLAAVEQLPIILLEATRERVLAAAHIKANWRISYADAFAVAAALELNGVLITGDPEFKAIEHLARVEWLPVSA